MIKELSDGSVKFIGSLAYKRLILLTVVLLCPSIVIVLFEDKWEEFSLVFLIYVSAMVFRMFHSFVISDFVLTFGVGVLLDKRTIDLHSINTVRLKENTELIFYDKSGDQNGCMDLSFYKQEDIQVFLNMLSEKGIVIDIAEEMKEKGYVVPKNQHTNLSQQSQHYTKDTDEDKETMPRQRRRVVKSDTVDIPVNKDIDTPKQNNHKRRLEF